MDSQGDVTMANGLKGSAVDQEGRQVGDVGSIGSDRSGQRFRLVVRVGEIVLR